MTAKLGRWDDLWRGFWTEREGLDTVIPDELRFSAEEIAERD